MTVQPDNVFVFSYFKGRGDGLHLACSYDGYVWNALNNDLPFVTPALGGENIMRDPFLMPGSRGFHLVWTAGWRGKGIGYAFSPDLMDWSPQRWLGVMEHEPKAMNCWAPEIFFLPHEQEYIVYWASSIPGRFPETDDTGDEGLNHRMYYALTKDFEKFSETRLFCDPGFNVIDATVASDGERYLLFMKDETRSPCRKNIRVAISKDIFGGFRDVGPPLTGDYWAEGPTAIRIGKKWMVYFDKYKLNQIGAVSSDDLVNWRDISSEVRFPPGAQHGSVTRVARERIEHLL